MEVAPGVTTPGSWDLRDAATRMPWPRSMDGVRCLDVGMMDGFWAFEMERRGAGEVIAIDVADPGRIDHPYDRRPGPADSPRPRRGATFHVAAEVLRSRARYVEKSVYDLDDGELGSFDLIFIGYVIELVRDPIRALEAARSACRGRVILLDQVSWPLSLLHPRQPLARVAARPYALEWFVCNRAGLVRMVQTAGFEIEAATPFLRDRAGPAVDVKRDLPRPQRMRYALGLGGGLWRCGRG
jgi:tRNA (mo5U34)-methyltransferase